MGRKLERQRRREKGGLVGKTEGDLGKNDKKEKIAIEEQERGMTIRTSKTIRTARTEKAVMNEAGATARRARTDKASMKKAGGRAAKEGHRKVERVECKQRRRPKKRGRNDEGKKPANFYSSPVGAPTLPYGWTWKYTLGLRRMVEDRREQRMVALAQKTQREGGSYWDIREALRKAGFVNRAGRAVWANSEIRRMLETRNVLNAHWQKIKDNLDKKADKLEAAKTAAARAGAVSLEKETDVVLWGEAHLVNRDGSERRYWAHQVEDLRAGEANIIHLDGRDVGKTANLATLALHYALTTPKGSGLVAAALRGQLLVILEEIEYQLEQNPRIEVAIATGRGGHRKFQRLPYPRIEFENGSVLYFRPAGTYGEAFRSLHVDRIWVDEGAWLSEEAWRALRQCLRTGGKMRVYSTPNGVRKSTYYRLTQSERWRVFRWPSWINPTWNAEREQDLLEFYGGRGSVGWQHEVAGEHGAPSYGAFAPEDFARCVGDVAEYRCVTITGEGLADCDTEEEVSARLEVLLGVLPCAGQYWIGGDLGYTRDPTEIVVFREEEAYGGARTNADDYGQKGVTTEESETREGKNKSLAGRRLRLVLRVHMEQVGYPRIAECLGVLDRVYEPMAVGVDNGGNGLAVVQELMSLNKFRGRAGGGKTEPIGTEKGGGLSRFEGRLFGFDFGGVTKLELADGTEAKKRTKELMTTLINGALQRGELLFPAEDREIEDQFLTQTYSLTNGVVVYSKGNDHIIDAVRCAMLAREKVREDGMFGEAWARCPRRPPILFTFPWTDSVLGGW